MARQAECDLVLVAEERGSPPHLTAGPGMGSQRALIPAAGGKDYSHGAPLTKQDFLAWRSFLALLGKIWVVFDDF